MSLARRPTSLAARLFAAQLLVIVAGSVTVALVALTIAPGVYRAHATATLDPLPPDTSRHLQQAFGDALLVTLAVATVMALVVALAASWVLAVRLTSPLRALVRAAGRIALGGYGTRVPVARTRDELTILAEAFNAMAAALESTEQRRRELMADLAHELRTPLATVEGYLEAIADGVLPADNETVRVLRAETARLRRLVDDLAKVSEAEERQVELRRRPIQPAQLVADAMRAAERRFTAKGLRLVSRVDPHLPAVAVDPDRMAEVLANLLDNALRHTQVAGRVEITASAHAGMVELAVADTGEGIPPELLDRVFERFFRVDPARARRGGGSGIGLTICRAIVGAHGGTIRAHSQGVGHGARFVITLPTAAAG